MGPVLNRGLVCAAGVIAAVAGIARPARAQSNDSDVVPEHARPAAPTARPLTPGWIGPGRAAPLVYVGAEGGWDGVRRGPIMETNVEAALVGPISFRAGASVNPTDGHASPVLALKADVLDQDRHGVSAALFGGYRGQGFNLVPALEFGLALGRRTERLSLLSSVAYGQGLQRGERYGDVRLAGLARISRRADLHLGLDARARADLQYADDDPAGEPALDGVAGPILVWGVGLFALSAQAGMQVLSLRGGGPTQVGPTGRLGVGAAF